MIVVISGKEARLRGNEESIFIFTPLPYVFLVLKNNKQVLKTRIFLQKKKKKGNKSSVSHQSHGTGHLSERQCPYAP